MDVIIKGTPRPGHKKGQSMLYLCKMSKTPKLMHENDDSCDKLLDSFKNCFIGYEHFAKAFDVSLDKLAVSISSFDQLLDAVKAVWPGVNIMKIVFSRDKWEEVIGFYDETAKPISERTRARLISAIKERMD